MVVGHNQVLKKGPVRESECMLRAVQGPRDLRVYVYACHQYYLPSDKRTTHAVQPHDMLSVQRIVESKQLNEPRQLD
jgi:hypothetical protein